MIINKFEIMRKNLLFITLFFGSNKKLVANKSHVTPALIKYF